MSSLDLWGDGPLPPRKPKPLRTPQNFIAVTAGPDMGVYTNGPLTQTACEIVAGWAVMNSLEANNRLQFADPDHWARLQLLVLADHGEHFRV